MEDIEVVFLGTSCAMPTKKRSLPSIALWFKGQTYLFDCGEGTQRQMLKLGLKLFDVNTIFITHNHLDHYLGLLGFVRTLKLLKISQGLEPKLKIVVPKDMLFLKKGLPDFVEFIVINRAGKKIDMGPFTVTPFRVKHSDESMGYKVKFKDKIRFYEKKAKSLGLKGTLFQDIQNKGKLEINGKIIRLEDVSYIEKGKSLVYTGDTAPLNRTIKYAKNVDLLIHESSFLNENKDIAKKTNHSTALDAAIIAKKANVKKLILTHFSPRNKNEKVFAQEAKKKYKKTIAAYDGYRFKL